MESWIKYYQGYKDKDLYDLLYHYAHEWINGFYSVPESICKKLLEHSNWCDLNEITPMTDKESELRVDWFPMWGTMWAFNAIIDCAWINGEITGWPQEKVLKLMKDCGFRIYDSEDYGYLFGIDGCGYDFYEAHWIPLYLKRGLQWHEYDPKWEEIVKRHKEV